MNFLHDCHSIFAFINNSCRNVKWKLVFFAKGYPPKVYYDLIFEIYYLLIKVSFSIIFKETVRTTLLLLYNFDEIKQIHSV